LDDECEGDFMNTNTTNALLLLDCLLVEVKIKKSLEKAKVPEEDFDDRHEIFKLYNREKEVEEVKKCLVKLKILFLIWKSVACMNLCLSYKNLQVIHL
jgi:hypothetical protein